ncbi:unnamed protein product [Pylaiella littoralis]
MFLQFFCFSDFPPGPSPPAVQAPMSTEPCVDAELGLAVESLPAGVSTQSLWRLV